MQPRPTVEEIRRADAENFGHHVVDSLYAFVGQDDIAPTVLTHWVAGREYMNEHALLTPENQASRLLAFLWPLDAMIASPATVTEVLQTVRNRLVATHEELQPFAG